VKTAPVALVASTLAFAGTVTTGPAVSVTVTVKEAAPLLPRVSVAVQVTVVVASGKVAPLAGVQLTATLPSIPSVAVAVYVKAAPVEAVASTVALVGTVTTGPVVSVTVTVNDAARLLPRVSVAVHVTVVVPSGKVAPLAGVQVAATLPSTASLAVAV
jgi:ribosomal protein L10